MSRYLAIVFSAFLLLGLVLPARVQAASQAAPKQVVMQTQVTFSVRRIDMTTGQYEARWSGHVSGDINGPISGSQTGTIDFNAGTIQFQDQWTIQASDRWAIHGADSGTSQIMPASEPGQYLGATYTAKQEIVGAEGRYNRLRRCSGTETGIYTVSDPANLFEGEMQGELTLDCPGGNGNAGDDNDDDDNDDEDED